LTQDYGHRATEFYEALVTDPGRAIQDYLAPEFVWENPLPAGIPFGGAYQGVEGLGRYLGELLSAIDMTPLHFTDVVASGPVVALIGIEADTRVKSTGKHYTMPFVHVVRFNGDGRISHIREYNDTREMVAAFAA
jgi:ketosteroid isomerase-like protein